MRSLTILIGLALIATAISYKPIETIACNPTQCAMLKGKYYIGIVAGKLSTVNLETAEVKTRSIKKVAKFRR
jgi:hypothetical protein